MRKAHGAEEDAGILAGRLRELAEGLGATFFGVADLSVARLFVEAQGGARMARYPRAISVGIALLPDIMALVLHRLELAAAQHFSRHGYDVVNGRLDTMASQLSSVIAEAGYAALPVPASQTVDSEKLCGVFSHKLAAHLAGLGWIGKSCLLITPEVGPRARWATILTDAPLPARGSPAQSRCKECRSCVDACPVSAYTGESFRIEDPREARFAASKCQDYLKAMSDTQGVAVCGVCVYVCPHGGRRYPTEIPRVDSGLSV